MKIIFILLIVLFSFCVSSPGAGEIKGKVLAYGLFEKGHKEQIIKTPETAAGFVVVPPGKSFLTTQTNRIPARLGVSFGICYEISNLNIPNGNFFSSAHVVTHPPISKPDGKVWTNLCNYAKSPIFDGTVVSRTGFTFDMPYEVVTGLWRIDIIYEGKTLVTQEFTVYKE